MAYHVIISKETNNKFHADFMQKIEKRWFFDNDIDNIMEFVKKQMKKNKTVKFPFYRMDIDLQDSSGHIALSAWIVYDFGNYIFRSLVPETGKGIEIPEGAFFDYLNEMKKWKEL